MIFFYSRCKETIFAQTFSSFLVLVVCLFCWRGSLVDLSVCRRHCRSVAASRSHISMIWGASVFVWWWWRRAVFGERSGMIFYWSKIVLLWWWIADLSFLFSLVFIVNEYNAGQTSLNPSLNRDQQLHERGGPLVRCSNLTCLWMKTAALVKKRLWSEQRQQQQLPSKSLTNISLVLPPRRRLRSSPGPGPGLQLVCLSLSTSPRR